MNRPKLKINSLKIRGDVFHHVWSAKLRDEHVLQIQDGFSFGQVETNYKSFAFSNPRTGFHLVQLRDLLEHQRFIFYRKLGNRVASVHDTQREL